ncbi:hypothetical protein UY3_19003 [Chelonia mydas]|uniref:Myb/SANT-like DNA-binding domain-containing protein n=1 Tax=Chelonia mydas TaxID=8469 RepID=M7AGB7_CHEMY|nr:hypothetical protein UY3_19003 [Chelonia mydas]
MLTFCSKWAPMWSTLELLDLWGEEAVQSQLRYSHRNFDTDEQIACGTDEKGHERDMQQFHAKIKELRQAYQKAKEADHCSGAVPKTCHFYKELHAILSSDPTSTAKSPVDTWGRPEAAASRVNPGDEVMDEEAKLEEDVG